MMNKNKIITTDIKIDQTHTYIVHTCMHMYMYTDICTTCSFGIHNHPHIIRNIPIHTHMYDICTKTCISLAYLSYVHTSTCRHTQRHIYMGVYTETHIHRVSDTHTHRQTYTHIHRHTDTMYIDTHTLRHTHTGTQYKL